MSIFPFDCDALNDGKHLINRWVNVGEHAVFRHFLVVHCPRKHEKTHAEWRKTPVNSLFCPLKTPENTKKRDVQSRENGGEQRNTIRFSCVDRMFSVYFTCINRALTVRLTPVKQAFSWR